MAVELHSRFHLRPAVWRDSRLVCGDVRRRLWAILIYLCILQGLYGPRALVTPGTGYYEFCELQFEGRSCSSVPRALREMASLDVDELGIPKWQAEREYKSHIISPYEKKKKREKKRKDARSMYVLHQNLPMSHYPLTH